MMQVFDHLLLGLGDETQAPAIPDCAAAVGLGRPVVVGWPNRVRTA